MGICFWDVKMLWEARMRGGIFRETATIGHQSLYLHPGEVRFFREAFRSKFPQKSISPLENYKFGDYADNFLRDFLGVEKLSVIDFSSYEGANIFHDLNQPISESLQRKFDTVIDGGSLEHIFNFPVAIKNLMQLAKIGGSIFISVPANNLCGHGFYQFSPELMFRVFSKDNGFDLKRIVLYEAEFPSIELTPHGKAYEVIDPEKAKSRVGIISKKTVTMIVEAKKISEASIFEKAPLQSDYVTLWNENEALPGRSRVTRFAKNVVESMPGFLRNQIHGYRQKKMFSFSNRKFYKEI